MAETLTWFCKHCQVSGDVAVPSGEFSFADLVYWTGKAHEEKHTIGGYVAVMFLLSGDSGGTIYLQDGGVLNLRFPKATKATGYPGSDLFLFHVQ